MGSTAERDRAACPGDVVARAAALLAERLGAAVRLDAVATLSEPTRRNQLYRLAVETSAAGAPATVIVKRADPKLYKPSDPKNESALGLASDWAGAAFLASLPNARHYQHAPYFYGGDVPLGFIVLEDLGDDRTWVQFSAGSGGCWLVDRSLVPALLGRDPEFAATGLTAMMGALGRLHADTLGRQREFIATYESLSPTWRHEGDRFQPYMERRVRELPAQLALLGVELDAAAADELGEAATRFALDAPLTAYVHRDPCPDNCRFDGYQYRLFDLEFAGLGHAFIDATYGRAPFPSCWCCGLVPKAVVERMEAAYREELVKIYPAALRDDVFGRGILDGLAYWALVELGRLESVLAADRSWGITSVRPRLRTRLQAFVDAAASFGGMAATARCFAEVDARLARLWGKDATLALYPAFV